MEIQDMFVTHDKAPVDRDVTFNMIEDEDGEIFWGYGHQCPTAFIDEVNRWLVHTQAVTDPDDLFHPQTHKVEHLHARFKAEGDERFDVFTDLDVLNPPGPGTYFPVTRLML